MAVHVLQGFLHVLGLLEGLRDVQGIMISIVLSQCESVRLRSMAKPVQDEFEKTGRKVVPPRVLLNSPVHELALEAQPYAKVNARTSHCGGLRFSCATVQVSTYHACANLIFNLLSDSNERMKGPLDTVVFRGYCSRCPMFIYGQTKRIVLWAMEFNTGVVLIAFAPL